MFPGAVLRSSVVDYYSEDPVCIKVVADACFYCAVRIGNAVYGDIVCAIGTIVLCNIYFYCGSYIVGCGPASYNLFCYITLRINSLFNTCF